MRVAMRLGWTVPSVLLLAALVFAQVVQVVHEPVGTASPGRDIELEAYLDGVNPSDVQTAEIRFRKPGEDAFDFVEMFPDGVRFTGTIPGQYVTEEGLEYYLYFVLTDGQEVIHPPGTPYTVQSRMSGATAGESPVLVISPEPNSFTREEEVLIAVAFTPTDRAIDPNQVKIKVDGKNLTGKATITPEVLTVVAGKLEEGRHRVEIFHDGPDGREVLATWFFGTGAERKADAVEAQWGTVSGTVGTELRYQDRNDEQVGIANWFGSARHKYKKLTTTLRLRLTSLENDELQPQHRFLFTTGMPWWKLSVGDINPRYNEFALWGRRVRGVELSVDAGWARLQGIYG
ncbi:hypothetical protein GF324_04090, partial [bacterium]|nr:hypothetical protein [bacterium]